MYFCLFVYEKEDAVLQASLDCSLGSQADDKQTNLNTSVSTRRLTELVTVTVSAVSNKKEILWMPFGQHFRWFPNKRFAPFIFLKFRNCCCRNHWEKCKITGGIAHRSRRAFIIILEITNETDKGVDDVFFSFFKDLFLARVTPLFRQTS